jgi:hypothetical protein
MSAALATATQAAATLTAAATKHHHKKHHPAVHHAQLTSFQHPTAGQVQFTTLGIGLLIAAVVVISLIHLKGEAGKGNAVKVPKIYIFGSLAAGLLVGVGAAVWVGQIIGAHKLMGIGIPLAVAVLAGCMSFHHLRERMAHWIVAPVTALILGVAVANTGTSITHALTWATNPAAHVTAKVSK